MYLQMVNLHWCCARHHERGSGEPLRRGDAVSGNPRPPSYLSRRARQTSVRLAQEAQETVASVKALVDDERNNFVVPIQFNEHFV